MLITKLKYKVLHLKVDEALSLKGFGIGILLYFPKGDVIEHVFKLGFSTTNNEVEYETLIIVI